MDHDKFTLKPEHCMNTYRVSVSMEISANNPEAARNALRQHMHHNDIKVEMIRTRQQNWERHRDQAIAMGMEVD